MPDEPKLKPVALVGALGATTHTVEANPRLVLREQTCGRCRFRVTARSSAGLREGMIEHAFYHQYIDGEAFR